MNNISEKQEIEKKFGQDVENLKHSVIVANANYEIWWIYKKDRPRYVDLLNKI